MKRCSNSIVFDLKHFTDNFFVFLFNRKILRCPPAPETHPEEKIADSDSTEVGLFLFSSKKTKSLHVFYNCYIKINTSISFGQIISKLKVKYFEFDVFSFLLYLTRSDPHPNPKSQQQQQ